MYYDDVKYDSVINIINQMNLPPGELEFTRTAEQVSEELQSDHLSSNIEMEDASSN